MEQLVFDLVVAEPPSFDNFVAGSNAESIAALKRFVSFNVPAASEPAHETSLLLWGDAGAGKSHLLQAAVRSASERGERAALFAHPNALQDADIDTLSACALVAVDQIDNAAPLVQAQLFTLYNGLRATRGRLLAASRLSLVSLPLREDVRTRLGWGLVYTLAPLTDAEKPGALLAYSRQRGLRLSEDVIRYLLAHGRRDMTTLLATLAALDRHSLSTKRAITVPLLRDWLQRDMPLSNRG